MMAASRAIALGVVLVSAVIVANPAAQITRTPFAAGDGRAGAANLVSAGALVFPSGVEGTRPDPLDQVDEVVETLHRRLGAVGLGIGNMIQHTIHLKDGAAPPMQVLQRFHAAAWRLAPQLKEKPSAGTILRVPAFADERTAVMVDLVAANPGTGRADTFARVPFTFGPKEIVESLTVGQLVFTAGNEAMDFQFRKLVPTIDEQVEVVVGKIDATLKKSGLSIGNMIAHNLYVKRGTDPINVINKFHEAARKRAPGLGTRPSVGTLAIVDGMAADGFLLEVDAVAAIPETPGKPDRYARVPFPGAMGRDISKSVAVDDVLFLSGMEGIDSKGGISPNVTDQVNVAVAKIDETLKQSGLSIGSMIKHRLFIAKGQDVKQVRDAFHKAAIRLAPGLAQNPSAETIVVVEGLAGPQMLFEASVVAARGRR